MAKKSKFYVVWEGRKPGIYTKWDECQAQVDKFEAAKFKSFDTKAEAEQAFKQDYWAIVKKTPAAKTATSTSRRIKNTEVIWDSLCVDAACSGNPGDMEYRGVWAKNDQQVFHMGPFRQGTNNIGEFLALVHGIALLKREGKPDMPIYSDSKIAQGWIKAKKCKTKLELTAKNKDIFELIERAENWLAANKVTNPILKWKTKDWGEIPADFGRK